MTPSGPSSKRKDVPGACRQNPPGVSSSAGCLLAKEADIRGGGAKRQSPKTSSESVWLMLGNAQFYERGKKPPCTAEKAQR